MRATRVQHRQSERACVEHTTRTHKANSLMQRCVRCVRAFKHIYARIWHMPRMHFVRARRTRWQKTSHKPGHFEILQTSRVARSVRAQGFVRAERRPPPYRIQRRRGPCMENLMEIFNILCTTPSHAFRSVRRRRRRVRFPIPYAVAPHMRRAKTTRRGDASNIRSALQATHAQKNPRTRERVVYMFACTERRPDLAVCASQMSSTSARACVYARRAIRAEENSPRRAISAATTTTTVHMFRCAARCADQLLGKKTHTCADTHNISKQDCVVRAHQSRYEKRAIHVCVLLCL